MFWKRRSKYGNRKTEIDGIIFSSQREGRRYLELKMKEKAGKIKDLILQPVYTLQNAFVDNMGNKHRPITYIADFSYFDVDFGKTVVEDAKGMRTELYRLKKKLFLKQLPEGWVFQEV